MKVKRGYYERQRRPWVQLKGYWLEAARSIIDAPIRVRVMEGCLVLTILTPRESVSWVRWGSL